MKRINIGIVLILVMVLIIGVLPINYYASDGTKLYEDVSKALEYSHGQLRGSDMTIEPTDPINGRKASLGVMQPIRVLVDDIDEYGRPIYIDEYTVKKKDVLLGLKSTELSTYASPTSKLRYKTISHTYLLTDPNDKNKVLYKAKITGDIEKTFDDIAKGTQAYKDGYRKSI